MEGGGVLPGGNVDDPCEYGSMVVMSCIVGVVMMSYNNLCSILTAYIVMQIDNIL